MTITISFTEFVALGHFIVDLVGLCYVISRSKKDSCH